MHKWFWVVVIALFIGLGAFAGIKVLHKEEQVQKTNNKGTLSLASPVFTNGETIPSKFSCKGENVNPPLIIKGVPEQTKSLVIIMHDPDAPSGDFIHWLVWNISPQIAGIKENSVPNEAVQGTTSFGETMYSGPCPPSGSHRYIFDLYALDDILSTSERTDKDSLMKVMQGHILNQTTLTGLFGE